MESRKRKRLVLAIAGLMLLLAAPFLLIAPGPQEPTYEGKRLSEWIELNGGAFYGRQLDDDARYEAAGAIQAIGTNALPHLLSEIAYQPKGLRLVVLRNWQRIPSAIRQNRRFFQLMNRPGMRANMAVESFKILRSRAGSVIPELSQLAQSTNHFGGTRSRALSALACIGPDAIPAMLGVVSNLHQPADLWMLGSVMQLGTDMHRMIPALVPQLQNTNLVVAMAILQFLRMQSLDPEILAPVSPNA